MFLLNLKRILKFSFQNFYRNIWLSLITLTIIVLTLLSLTSLIIINAAANQTLISIKEKIDISLYFPRDVQPEQVQLIKETIKKYDTVREVAHISADEALAKFKARHAGDKMVEEALAELEENPLGPTLTVKAKDVNLYPSILERLNRDKINELVQEIDYDDHKLIISKLEDISAKLKKSGLVVSGIFALISLLIVLNTIRIGIYTHRNEIGIMKLVGATNWFIRAPFLIEGIFYALLGTFIFWLIFYLLIGILQPILYRFFIDIDFNLVSYLSNNLIYIFGFELILIIVLNIISTSIAIGRYLRV